MPKAEFCPTCNKRMQRLYERERIGYGGGKSKYWGYLWICSDRHIAIIDHRKSESPKVYEMQEVLADVST